MIKLIGEVQNINTGDEYKVYEVVGVISHDPDHNRKLYKIVKKGPDKFFYKALCLSRTNLAIERNKDRSDDKIWDDLYSKYVENPLLNKDETNSEMEIADHIFRKELNPEDGSYLSDTDTNPIVNTPDSVIDWVQKPGEGEDMLKGDNSSDEDRDSQN